MKSSQQVQHGHNETRRVSEWGAGSRIAGPIVVFLALMFGNAQWVRSGLDSVAANEPAPAQGTADSTVYFPAQYTNQATAAEAQTESF